MAPGDVEDSAAEQRVQDLFRADNSAQELGIGIESITDGVAELSMKVTESMINGLDLCHGGFLFAFADTALAYASVASNHSALTQSASIDFVQPARLGEVLTAKGEVVMQHGKVGHSMVTITNEAHEPVAILHGRTHHKARTRS